MLVLMIRMWAHGNVWWMQMMHSHSGDPVLERWVVSKTSQLPGQAIFMQRRWSRPRKWQRHRPSKWMPRNGWKSNGGNRYMHRRRVAVARLNMISEVSMNMYIGALVMCVPADLQACQVFCETGHPHRLWFYFYRYDRLWKIKIALPNLTWKMRDPLKINVHPITDQPSAKQKTMQSQPHVDQQSIGIKFIFNRKSIQNKSKIEHETIHIQSTKKNNQTSTTNLSITVSSQSQSLPNLMPISISSQYHLNLNRIQI